MKLSTRILGKRRENFLWMGEQAPIAAPLMKSPSSKRRTGAGLPAGKAMDSENVPRKTGWVYTHLNYSNGGVPLQQKP